MRSKLKALTYYGRHLYEILTPRMRRLAVLVFIATLVNSAFQLLGISALLPLTSALVTPDEFMENRYVQWFSAITGMQNFHEIFVVLCIGVALLYVIKNLFFAAYMCINLKYACYVQRELADKVLKSLISRPYDYFLNCSTSEFMRDVKYDSTYVNNLISWLFNLITEGVTVVLVLIYITMSDVGMAGCIFVLALLCLLVIYKGFHRITKVNGARARLLNAENDKNLMEISGGIKEIQVSRSQAFFVERFDRSYADYQKPTVILNLAAVTPTYAIEAIFVVGLLIYICVQLLQGNYGASSVPALATFMVAAIRLLPSLGRTTNSFNNIIGVLPSLESLHRSIIEIQQYEESSAEAGENKINDELDGNRKLAFQSNLYLDRVCFHYPKASHNVIDGLTLRIEKGESIGLVGQSGAGKSTLADIVLGLHIPQSGHVTVDGENIYANMNAYSRMIAYVPQDVYLMDRSIRENIAFGMDSSEIDDSKVWKAVERASLVEFVNDLEEGLNTIVGERGVRLSGGQRQRIAIARALYKDPEILILDEATSALDNGTEEAIMEEMENLYGTITMIVVAHRLTTVMKCDRVYEIRGGKAIEKDKAELR